MPYLNYEEELNKVEKDLKDGDHINVGAKCGFIFEELLKNLYNEIKKKAGKSLLQKIENKEVECLHKFNSDDLTTFSLGQTIELFDDLKLLDNVKKLLEKDVNVLKAVNLMRLADIRNRSLHDVKVRATQKEVEYLYYCLKLILEELDYVSKNKCPKCHAGLLNNWNFCTSCGETLKITCPECRSEVKENYKTCPKCNEQLYILSKTETEILIKQKTFLSKNNDWKPCPICGDMSQVCSADYDEETGIGSEDYEFMCNCMREIAEILKFLCIKNNLKYKYIRFLDSITGTTRPPGYFTDFFLIIQRSSPDTF